MSWNSGFKPIRECPYMKNSKTLLVSKEVIDMARILSSKLTGNEWLIYCDCDEDATTIKIHDCIIPKQKVTAGTVDVIEGRNMPVVMHSHHTMGGSFSYTDEEYLNANHKISMVWTESKGISSVVMKRNLPCGHVALVEVEDIMVYIPPDYDYDEVVKKVEEQIENIEAQTYVYRPYQYYGYKIYYEDSEEKYEKLWKEEDEDEVEEKIDLKEDDYLSEDFRL